MPNGTLEDKFNIFFFRKGIWSRVLGTSQGGFHPRVGARCYLLNKLVFNKLELENLICLVIRSQETFLKILRLIVRALSV